MSARIMCMPTTVIGLREYHVWNDDPRKATASTDFVHGFVGREDAVSYQDKALDDIVEWMRFE